MDKIFNISKLADYLGVSQITLYRMVKRGEIPVVRIGGSLRFPKQLIDDWLAKKAKTTPAPLPFLEHEKKAVEEFIRRLKKEYGKKFQALVLFGSKARGDWQEGADIDLLLLMQDPVDWKLAEAIQDLSHEIDLKYNLLLSPLAVSVHDYQSGRFAKLPLHDQIEAEGIKLYGDKTKD